HILGLAGGVVVLLVAHTYPEEGVARIVSARKATRLERRAYEDGDP
ncbi:MAG: BrnT family toxin, partial [Acetobacteraceae bacterium]